MPARFKPAPHLKETIEGLPGVVDQLDQRAERIATTTTATSLMGATHRRRYGRVIVTKIAQNIRRVAALGPFAHLEEWGSANNAPRATMRRAAEREGRFRPEG